MNWDKLFAGIMGGILLPIFGFLYGPGSAVISVMVVLVFFIAMDWISGSSASKKDASYSSEYGHDGVRRTLFILMLPAGGHLLDVVLGTPGILFGLLAFGVIKHTINSMAANCIRAGWANRLPMWAIDTLTNWVQSEIESKISRARQRLDQRNGKAGM